jgi:transposase
MGIDNYIYREKARSLRGKRVIGAVSGKKYKRTNIMAAKCGEAILAPLEYTGTTNYKLVKRWLINMLFPLLVTGCSIILDNASFHKKKELSELVKGYGFTIIFLPPYSPDCNPIEHFWAWMKSHIRKIIKNCDTLSDAIGQCFQT